MLETMITASVLILALLLLRPLLRHRVSPMAVYALWGFVALRLIVPWLYPLNELLGTVRSRLSVMNVVDTFHREVIVGSRIEPLADNLTSGRVYRFDAPVTLAGRAAGVDWQLWITAVWMTGSILLAGWMIFVNIRFLRGLRAGRRPYQGPLPAFVTQRVYVAAGLTSPCYFGIGQERVIYLPESIAGDEHKVLHALAHESAHAAHGDGLWGILRCVLLCFYCINPLVWLAVFCSKQDCELACDEAAVKLLGENERYAYGRTLVELVAGQRGSGELFSAATTMTAGKRSMRVRVKALARHPVSRTPMMLVLAVIVMYLGICTFTRNTLPDSTGAVGADADILP